jgi:hypothetical protein
MMANQLSKQVCASYGTWDKDDACACTTSCPVWHGKEDQGHVFVHGKLLVFHHAWMWQQQQKIEAMEQVFCCCTFCTNGTCPYKKITVLTGLLETFGMEGYHDQMTNFCPFHVEMKFSTRNQELVLCVSGIQNLEKLVFCLYTQQNLSTGHFHYNKKKDILYI